MRVLLLSTYPPRACGIATFSFDLRAALLTAGGVDTVDVAAMDTAGCDYPPEVVTTVAADDPAAYRAAARLASGYDAVCVQHEFGIFGGPSGRYLLEFLDRLTVPAVTTLHTVLGNPSAELRQTLADVASASDRVVALSAAAVPLLADHGVDPARVVIIPHGVPEASFEDPDAHKPAVGLAGRTVLLTFGLLSRNKGIDYALEALPKVVAAHPDVVYVVLGATHPEVRRHEGEAYRRSLEERIRQLGLERNVELRDRFVSLEELREHLLACDIYLTPYQAREQISSGTLAYAIGMGRAVVSTPYRHAEELLADGRGLLVPFNDVEALSDALLRLLDDEQLRQSTRERAYEFGRSMSWPSVGRRTAALLAEVAAEGRARVAASGAAATPLAELADPAVCAGLVKLDHLQALTDSIGIIQHAAYGVPDRRHGYTTDDQSRALVAVVDHHELFADPVSSRLASTYLSYLQLAQRPDGRFRNVMDHSGRWLDELGSEDTLGQSVWGLGVAAHRAPTDGQRELAAELLAAAVPAAVELRHVRSIAYALLGLCEAILVPEIPGTRAAVETLAQRLVEAFARFSRPGWDWCDEVLTYANTKPPEALLRAGTVLERPAWTRLGLQVLDFVLDQTFDGDRFDPVGNEDWRRHGGMASVFAQQPIEAGYTAQVCRYAHDLTGDTRYARYARMAVAWLLGRNRLGSALYEPATGLCRDGLERHGVNRNAGAESVVCALLGLLALARPAGAAAAPTAPGMAADLRDVARGLAS